MLRVAEARTGVSRHPVLKQCVRTPLFLRAVKGKFVGRSTGFFFVSIQLIPSSSHLTSESRITRMSDKALSLVAGRKDTHASKTHLESVEILSGTL